MNILDIYQRYQIMPQLQEHQLRVAGVASLICENFDGNLNQENVIAACLLHDMGNIVKFNFDEAHRALLPKEEIGNLEYWEKLKKETMQKYGTPSHTATDAILKEMGVSTRILELVDSVGFSQGEENIKSEDFEKKICAYCDMRVGPFGVISLEERLLDLRERYKNHPEGVNKRDVFENALYEIEKQIFAKCKIQPADINPEAVNKKFGELRNYQI